MRVDRPRLPAVAGHRQGGAERPPGRPAHRLPDRHPQRRAARRRGRDPLAGGRPGAAALRARRRRASGRRPSGRPGGHRPPPRRAEHPGSRHALECRVAETSIPVRTCVGCRTARSGHRSAACRRPVRGSGPGSSAAAPRPGSIGAPHPGVPARSGATPGLPPGAAPPRRRRRPLEAGPLRAHVLGASSEAPERGPGRASTTSSSLTGRTGTRPVRMSTGHRRMTQP